MSFAPSHLPRIFGLLDIGTSKIVCLMLEHSPTPMGIPFRIIGVGHQVARGLKASVIIDSDAAEEAVRSTVSQAQHMAGLTLEHVVIAAACGRLTSTHIAAERDLSLLPASARGVAPEDVELLLNAGRSYAERDDRAVLNINALAARIDGRTLSGDAHGAVGAHLSLDVHAIAADRAPLRNLMHVVERCGLQVIAVAAAPLAAAYAVTTPEERNAGVTVIDMGAGSTKLAVFIAGAPICAHVVPIGSNHLTFDLMRAFDLPLTEAERIKKNYAIQPLAHAAQTETISDFPRDDTHVEASSASAKQVTRADITDILTSRLDALFGQLLSRIDQLAIPRELLGGIVLTGGGSLLAGLPVFATSIFGGLARIAAPAAHGMLPRALLHPAFATAAGLHVVAMNPKLGLRFDTYAVPVRQHANPTSLRRSF